MTTRLRPMLALAALLAACGGLRGGVSPTPPTLTHGMAVGEVSDTSAIVWGRCDRAGSLHVRLDGERQAEVAVDAERDYTGRIALADLTPNTRYAYRAWCSADGDNARGDRDGADGHFTTAPAPDAARPLRILWSGDLGGQNVCRDATRGYPIFPVMAARQADLFIALGDMIYGDDACHPTGRYGNAQIPGPPPARDRAGYWAHWRYNRADPGQQALLAGTPMAAVWDDHEIVNDAGPAHDSPPGEPDVHLLAPALAAFLDYQPLQPPAADPTRLYRSQRWGKHVEIFLLDTRQYRDPNGAPDDPAAPKSLLGPQQRRWLEEAIGASTATWKIIVASVPLAIPTNGDGFASGDTDRGFEHEAAELFAVLHQRGVRNPLWITTDVHFATGFVYRPIADDPQWESRELITGPLNAGVFPQQALDPTFRPERLFFYAPPSADGIPSFDDAVRWFNFGVIEVLASGRLSVSIVNGEGQTVYRMTLKPQSAGAPSR
ncbi:alkaline phosphatase D family protein [bacterium]|nr:alkaline phosphatase D family protein [bacterium]